MTDPLNAYQVATQIVQDKFDDYVSQSQGYLDMVTSALNGLINYLKGLEPQHIDVTLDEVPNPELDEFSPDRPPTPVIEVDLPVKPDIPPFNGIDLSDLELPTVGDVTLPTISIDAGRLEYGSSLLIMLKAKLLRDLEDGGTGVDPDVEAAIFHREEERALQVQNDALDKAADIWASRGFPIPDDFLRDTLTQIQIEHSNKRLDTSRDVAIKSFELAQQNTQFAVQQGIAIEAQLMNFANACQGRLFEASKARVDAEVTLFTAQLQKYKVMADIYTSLVNARVEEAKATIEVYTSQVLAYKAAVEAEKARIDAISEAFKAEIERYKADASVYETVSNVAIKVFEARIQQALAKANVLIKDAEIGIKNWEVISGLNVEAMKTEGAVLAQIVAGLMSSVSAAAEVRASGSTSTDTNYNRSL